MVRLATCLILAFGLLSGDLLAQEQAIPSDTLWSQAGVAYGEGDYQEAVRLLRLTLAARAEEYGSGTLPYAEVLDDLGYVLIDAGDLEAAEAALNEALQIRASQAHPDSLDVGDSHENLARLHLYKKDLVSAIEHHLQADKGYANYYGRETSSYAYFLYSWGIALYDTEYYSESVDPFQRAADHYIAAETEASMNALYCLRNVAYSHLQAQEYDESVAAYARLFDVGLQNEAASPEVPEWFFELGEAYLGAGDLASVKTAFSKSLDRTGELYGADTIEFAKALFDIAKAYENASQWAESRGYYERAKPLYKRHFGVESTDYVYALAGISWTLIGDEDFGAAFEVFKELIPLTAAVLSEESINFQNIVGNFHTAVDSYGPMLFDKGDFAAYTQLHVDAQRLEKTASGESDYYSIFVFREGEGFAYAGDTVRAIARLNDFLDLEKRQYGEETEDYAYGLRTLANLHHRHGEIARADSLYRRSIELYEAATGKLSAETAQAYSNLGKFLADIEEYGEALEIYSIAAIRAREGFGESNTDLPIYMYSMAALYRRMGSDSLAVLFALDAIHLEDTHRRDSSIFAITWRREVADYLARRGENQLAAQLYAAAMDRIEETELETDIYFHVVHSLSGLLSQSGMVEELLRLLHKAVRFSQLHPVDDSDLWMRIRLGTELGAAGKYAAADTVYSEAIEGFRERFGTDHSYVGGALMAYSTLFIHMGEFERSEEIQEEASRIIEHSDPISVEREMFAMTLYTMGIASTRTGRYNRAIRYMEQAGEIYAADFATYEDEYLNVLQSLSLLYQLVSRQVDLINVSLEALEMYEVKYSRSDKTYIDHLAFLGLVYASFGDNEKAAFYLREAEKILVDSGRQGTLSHIYVLTNFAAMNAMASRYDNQSIGVAREYIDKALALHEQLGETAGDIYQTTLRIAAAVSLLEYDFDGSVKYLEMDREVSRAEDGERSESYLSISSQIISALVTVDRKEVALAEAEDLLVLASDVFGENDLRYAEVLSRYGGVLLHLDRPADAIPPLEQARSIIYRLAGDESQAYAGILAVLSRAYYIAGNYGVAAEMLDESFALTERYLASNFGMSSMEAMYRQLEGARGLGDVIDIAIGDPNQSLFALKWVLRRKGLVTRTIADYRFAQRAALDDPETRVLLENLQDARQSLVNMQLAGGEDVQAKEDIILRQQSYITDLENKLKDRVTRPGSGVINMEDFFASLGNRYLIDIVKVRLYSPDLSTDAKTLTDPKYVGLVVSADTVHVVDLGDAERMDDLVLEYTDAIDSARRDFSRGDDEAYLEEEILAIGADLYERFFAPLARYLPDNGSLIFSPDGELNRLPIPALVDNDGKYLIESYDISYVSSGGDLRPTPNEPGSGTIVFAGPDFDLGTDSRPPLAQTDSPGLQVRGPDKVVLRGMKWDPLEGAALEAQDVEDTLNETEFGPVTTFKGASAVEESFKLINAPRVLHVATHGYFLTETDEEAGGAETVGGADFGAARGLGMLRGVDNPLLRSGIILAGANNIGLDEDSGFDDGWVTAEEISLMDLRGTDLVVLSACESGLGDIRSGQSVQGLRQAFQLAGARTIVSSLYKVPDIETRQIMQSFYSNVRSGMNTTTALNEAQRSMIADRRSDHDAAHPFFWASFIAVGTE